MKIAIRMDVLRCETVDGVMKELAMFTPAYNLIASLRAESARVRGAMVDRAGFLDASRWLTDPESCDDPSRIAVNPARPDRIEPRVRKRRPERYPLMKEPRSALRNRLLGKDVAS